MGLGEDRGDDLPVLSPTPSTGFRHLSVRMFAEGLISHDQREHDP